MGDKSGKFLAQDFRIENHIFEKSNYLFMKKLLIYTILPLLCAIFLGSCSASGDSSKENSDSNNEKKERKLLLLWLSGVYSQI